MKAALIFLFLLFGCGGDAGAKPCLPVELVHIKGVQNNSRISEGRLESMLKNSKQYFKDNLRFVRLCITSEEDAWFDYEPPPEELWEYWFGQLGSRYDYGTILVGIIPSMQNKYVLGNAVLNSYLSETPAVAMAWCRNDEITCRIIFLHELLHTVGATHHGRRNLMSPSLDGADDIQLTLLPETFTEVRRYLKRRGIL